MIGSGRLTFRVTAGGRGRGRWNGGGFRGGRGVGERQGFGGYDYECTDYDAYQR